MTKRRCGDCQLCCRLLPTEEIKKPALARCPHGKHSVGCRLRQAANECALWVAAGWSMTAPPICRGLIARVPSSHSRLHHHTHDDAPPDHMEVIQAGDPVHKDAHREPRFRQWLDGQRKPALIRYSPRDGFVLFPPSTRSGVWHEEMSGISGKEHSLEEKAAASAAHGGAGLQRRHRLPRHAQGRRREYPAGTLDVGSTERRREIHANAEHLLPVLR